MTESITISAIIPATPKDIYAAWLDSKKHSAMTGEKATIDPSIGGQFTAWEDFISGTTIELDPGHKIVQQWRTTDFPAGSPDSTLEVTLEDVETGTNVTIMHTGIPDSQGAELKDGWKEFYFVPMKKYFKKQAGGKKAAKKASKKASKKQAKKARGKRAKPAK
ncbi:MAG TPA: SRPBCC domain-containing protein [Candidatus Lokiarchaeia archaeon]|nr:SRPBCC domain-containing protein [Candidatus Lokiarchaeia archaeon]